MSGTKKNTPTNLLQEVYLSPSLSLLSLSLSLSLSLPIAFSKSSAAGSLYIFGYWTGWCLGSAPCRIGAESWDIKKHFKVGMENKWRQLPIWYSKLEMGKSTCYHAVFIRCVCEIVLGSSWFISPLLLLQSTFNPHSGLLMPPCCCCFPHVPPIWKYRPVKQLPKNQSCSSPPAHPPYLFHNDSRLSCGLARRETTPWIVDGGLIWKTCLCCTSKMFKHAVSWVSCRIFPCPVLRDHQR